MWFLVEKERRNGIFVGNPSLPVKKQAVKNVYRADAQYTLHYRSSSVSLKRLPAELPKSSARRMRRKEEP